MPLKLPIEFFGSEDPAAAAAVEEFYDEITRLIGAEWPAGTHVGAIMGALMAAIADVISTREDPAERAEILAGVLDGMPQIVAQRRAEYVALGVVPADVTDRAEGSA